ncbi:MAG: FMN-binding negative transcriptional regulator [Sphingorhabdus sp.]
MHPDGAFRWNDKDAMRSLASEISFGMLFLTTAEGPRVAHLPFVFVDDDRIGFHMSRGNALAKHLHEEEVLFVVNGPDCYISPDWYGIKDQVPTWNYVALELQGRVHKMDEEALISQIDALSCQQENKLAPKPVWTRAKMSNGYFNQLLSGISGFEMTITAWRSTLKLGQNKNQIARNAAADGAEGAGAKAMADLMRNLSL